MLTSFWDKVKPHDTALDGKDVCDLLTGLAPFTVQLIQKSMDLTLAMVDSGLLCRDEAVAMLPLVCERIFNDPTEDTAPPSRNGAK